MIIIKGRSRAVILGYHTHIYTLYFNTISDQPAARQTYSRMRLLTTIKLNSNMNLVAVNSSECELVPSGLLKVSQ